MLITVLLLVYIEFVLSENMEAFIVGGKDVDILYSGHSVFLTVQIDLVVYVCGASILNQNIIITAAHCFVDLSQHSKVTVRAGHVHKMQGSVRNVKRLVSHNKFDRNTAGNDIALAYFKKPLLLGSSIKRVIVMKDTPKINVGYVDGWGMIDDIKQKGTSTLKRLKQPLWSRDECKKLLRRVPMGILCGGAQNSKEYAAEGDSGSALVVNDSIQVGLVSFKRPEISNSIIVYTELSYFYKWIMNASRKIFCK